MSFKPMKRQDRRIMPKDIQDFRKMVDNLHRITGVPRKEQPELKLKS